MYIIGVYIAPSSIEGDGVFSTGVILKGTTVWLFEPGYDLTMTRDAYANLSDNEREHMDHSAYLSPWSGLWVVPPKDDPANFTNHSQQNNLTVVYDDAISSEPYFIANRDIAAAEEITNNYPEFDRISQATKADWLS